MKYIAETLGIKTAADDAPWAGVSRLQYFLTDAYGFTPVTLGEVKCLFVKPKGELAAISAVKKHLAIIAEQAGVPLVLDTPALDAKQRKALIAAQIPFMVEGNQLYLPFLGAEHIIPFKAKAWLDLTERKANGGQIDSKHIKKHKNDVITMSQLLSASGHIELPAVVRADFAAFIAANADSADRLRRAADYYGL